ncbi:MAG: sulfite exporter TauE/SafE family protein, partial [Rhodospirillales bacterium]
MFGYEWEMIAIMSAALIVGGVVKGVVGLGLPIVTMAILLNFMPPLVVLGLLVAPILVTNLWQALRAGNLLEPLRRFWPMIVMALIFLFIGAQLIVAMNTQVLFGVLGVCVVVFSGTSLFRPNVPPLKPETEKWAGPLAGALGGLLGGISTIWGPPMMMYFVMLKLPKDTFVRT